MRVAWLGHGPHFFLVCLFFFFHLSPSLLTLLTDEEIELFEIKKGTKQGDPLSSLLFSTVLQKALEDYIPRWQKKKRFGILPV